ncbi:nitroreductase family protein [Methanobrevibacter sp. DSM 116169]|uniref:nitroreductase family protein n=1 Tax=Methanobrevibacter sp. DSM 116169 TaxID=3242727 RepID=UPI0038FC2441
MDTMDIIKKRRSIRNYTNEKIDENILKEVINTATIAPVAGEFQITVIENQELLEKYNIVIKEFLKNSPDENMKAMGENPNYNAFYGANTLVLFSAPDENPFGGLTTSLAAENMILAATEFDLGTCYMVSPIFPFNDGANNDLLKEFNLPDGFKPVCAVTIGKISPENENPKRPALDNVNYVK